MSSSSGLMFPKEGTKKKRRRAHPASIMHRKEDGTCFLCMLLEGNFQVYGYREEHHVFFSGHQRALSEEYGLKVYLCYRHHREGPDAVHNNKRYRRMLEAEGQKAFEERYGHKKFIEIFQENYIYEDIA